MRTNAKHVVMQMVVAGVGAGSVRLALRPVLLAVALVAAAHATTTRAALGQRTRSPLNPEPDAADEGESGDGDNVGHISCSSGASGARE